MSSSASERGHGKAMLLRYRNSDYLLRCNVIGNIPERGNDGIVIGADTESVQCGDVWDPQLLTVAGAGWEKAIWLYGYNPLAVLIDAVSRHENVGDTVPKAYVFFHNLEYDWTQLLKYNDVLFNVSRFQQLYTPVTVWLRQDLCVRLLRAMFKGPVCYVNMKVIDCGNEWQLELRDTFAYFRSSLAKAAKDFGLSDKLDRPPDIGHRDYRQLPVDDPERLAFESYALQDARLTRGLGLKVAEMHDLERVYPIKVSPSSYGAAVMSRKLGERTMSAWCAPKEIIQRSLDAYHGGRFGGLVVGKVDGLYVYDIHSSYPAALSALPAFGKRTWYGLWENLPLKEALPICREFPCTFALVSGEATDAFWPALITRLPNGDLCPVYGCFERVWTSGAELLAGCALKGLKNVRVHELLSFWDEGDSFFHDLMHELYELKRSSAKDSVQYHMAKVVMNSIYGKMIEAHEPNRLLWKHDMAVLVKKGQDRRLWGETYRDLYMLAAENDKDPYQYIEQWMEENITNPEEYEAVGLSTLPLSREEFGYYCVPPLAAAVTGIARARLYLAMKATEALYWDTDSVFCRLEPEEVAKRLAAIPVDVYPKNVPVLKMGEDLGDLALEKANVSGYLAGIKRYWFGQDKTARHSMAVLPGDKMEEAIRQLVETGSYEYQGDPRPVPITEAKTAAEVGMFVPGSWYRISLCLDYRMFWKRDDVLYRGCMKPLGQILTELARSGKMNGVT